jgi:protein gp37
MSKSTAEWKEATWNTTTDLDKVSHGCKFKQWSTRGPHGIKRSKKANGRVLSGKSYDEMPEFKIA